MSEINILLDEVPFEMPLITKGTYTFVINKEPEFDSENNAFKAEATIDDAGEFFNRKLYLYFGLKYDFGRINFRKFSAACGIMKGLPQTGDFVGKRFTGDVDDDTYKDKSGKVVKTSRIVEYHWTKE